MDTEVLKIGNHVDICWKYNEHVFSGDGIVMQIAPPAIVLMSPVDAHGFHYRAGRRIVLNENDFVKQHEPQIESCTA